MIVYPQTINLKTPLFKCILRLYVEGEENLPYFFNYIYIVHDQKKKKCGIPDIFCLLETLQPRKKKIWWMVQRLKIFPIVYQTTSVLQLLITSMVTLHLVPGQCDHPGNRIVLHWQDEQRPTQGTWEGQVLGLSSCPFSVKEIDKYLGEIFKEDWVAAE